jgi:integrase
MERQVKRPWLFLTDEEVKKIEDVVDNCSFYIRNPAGEYYKKRDLMIIKLSRKCGFRPNECLTLEWEQIDFENRVIYVNPYSNKQRDAQTAKFDYKVKDELLEYKKFVCSFLISPFLFPCLQTLLPMDRSHWAKRLNKLAAEAGVRKIVGYTRGGNPVTNTYPYVLRKYFGRNFYMKTKDSVMTMKALRQKKLSSINPYVDYTDKEVGKAFDFVCSIGEDL